MDVETGSIIWRENYDLKIKMDKCKLFVNLIKKSFTKRHWGDLSQIILEKEGLENLFPKTESLQKRHSHWLCRLNTTLFYTSYNYPGPASPVLPPESGGGVSGSVGGSVGGLGSGS